MKISNLLLLFSCLAILSCSKAENKPGYQINGTITTDYEGFVYLRYLDQLDSALVQDNQFTFTGTVPHVVEASLSADKGPTADGFYFGNEVVNISIVKNGKYFFNQAIESQTLNLMDSVETAFGEILENNTNPNAEINDFLTTLITRHPDNQFITEVLSDIIGEANMLTLEQSEALVKLINQESMDKDYYRSMMIAIERMKKLNVGDPFIDFSLNDLQGNTVKPSDFKGKYLLVDLWASWCGPCRKANPELKKLHALYREKGFEILSLSLDNSEAAWKKAVAKDELTWTNVKTEGGLRSDIAQQLGVVFIPFNYLINPEGEIMHINVDLATVREELEKL